MKWKVLVSAPYMQPVIHHFEENFSKNEIEVILPPTNERMEEKELLKWIPEMDGAICGDDRFTEKVLRSAPRLKVISKWGTGIDSIDQEACKKLGITICNTPNAFSEPVADTVIGYILCFSRNLYRMDIQMRQGIWNKIPGKALRECTLGVIGIGNVGKTVVRRAQGFGIQIFGNDIIDISRDFLKETGIEIVSKRELLEEVDFLSLNCDLNPSSYHLMTYEKFQLMKPTAVVINTARGPIIKETDLVKALQEKILGGAALDVFENEPLPEDSPLLTMENVLLAPHNANSSPEAWGAVHLTTISNLIKTLKDYDK
jgi:D-3-phosphoglycerate dehydrogenase